MADIGVTASALLFGKIVLATRAKFILCENKYDCSFWPILYSTIWIGRFLISDNFAGYLTDKIDFRLVSNIKSRKHLA